MCGLLAWKLTIPHRLTTICWSARAAEIGNSSAITGYDRLHNPRLNKGTAFTEAERRKYGLEGLLPPAVTNIELQVARRRAEITNLADDQQKYS